MAATRKKPAGKRVSTAANKNTKRTTQGARTSSNRSSTAAKSGGSARSKTRVEERKERRGKTSVTYKEYYDVKGQLIKKETAYEDSYPSIEGLVYVSSNLYR